MPVFLKLQVTMTNELSDLGHERGEYLANVFDAPLLHQLEQAELRERYLNLDLASAELTPIQDRLLDLLVGVRSLDLTKKEALSGAVKSIHEEPGHLLREHVFKF